VIEYEELLYNKNKEFGNIMQSREVYEAVQRYSPYHMFMSEDNRPMTDLLISVDEELGRERYHARKMVAKLRDVYNNKPLYAFYREFSSKMYTDS